jgi:hypothetical protein
MTAPLKPLNASRATPIVGQRSSTIDVGKRFCSRIWRGSDINTVDPPNYKMDIPDFLNALKDVATSPYAFVGYALVVCVWITREWFVSQPQKKVAVILKQYKKDEDRTNALRELIGTAPPKGLKPDEILDWIKTKAKEKSRIFLLIAYLSTLVVALNHRHHRN